MLQEQWTARILARRGDGMLVPDNSERFPSRKAARLVVSTGWILLAVGASTLVRFAIAPLIADGLAYTTYFPSILLVTAFLGWRAGAATLILSTLIATYLFLPPVPAMPFASLRTLPRQSSLALNAKAHFSRPALASPT